MGFGTQTGVVSVEAQPQLQPPPQHPHHLAVVAGLAGLGILTAAVCVDSPSHLSKVWKVRSHNRMNAKNLTRPNPARQDRVLQIRVRCDVRAGDNLATCQANVNKWRDRYQTSFNQAKQRGCI